MWRIGKDSSGFGELGQSWSEPVVTTIPGLYRGRGISKPVLVFGAGYDTSKDAAGVGAPDVEGRGLFIVDAQTGALIWSVTPAINSATNLSEPLLLHSVPANVTVLDSNGDQLTDRIYFGDTGGNLWRVDLPGNALPHCQPRYLADCQAGGDSTAEPTPLTGVSSTHRMWCASARVARQSTPSSSAPATGPTRFPQMWTTAST